MNDFEKQLAKKVKNNPKAFYAYERNKMKTKSRIADLDKHCHY